MLTRLHAWTLRRPSLPVWLLGALVVVSLAARLAWIAEPCRSPCTTPNDHLLIFDEDYYVNAARVIVGIHPPHGDPYWNSPLGTDPNSEHPQLVKLLIAGGIELFGDGPFAWRLPSVLLGAVAILGMYALARAAGGGRWLGLGAAALMASDNLLLVHGRIGTLDVPAVAAMIWAAALYVRRRPLWAGVVLGIGACAKEVTPYLLFALLFLELFGWLQTRTDVLRRVLRLALCTVSTARSVPSRPGDHGLDRGALQPPDRQARAERRVRAPVAHHQLRRQPDEPARAAGDRLLPVGLADRHQADHLSPDQPGASDRGAQPDRARRPLPRDDQPADPPARVAGTARQPRERGPSTGARLVVVGWRRGRASSGSPGSSAPICRSCSRACSRAAPATCTTW